MQLQRGNLHRHTKLMDCKFQNDSTPDDSGFRFVRCRRCGFTSPRPLATPLSRIFRNCGKPGLGDRIAAWLAWLGITKAKVAEVTGGCGCDARQEALNELGKKIGL